IMQVYETDFSIRQKQDNSPVTLADQQADDTIRKFLAPAGLYVLSEEQTPVPYPERKDLEYLWIVDPLDGTKEFIRRNGEFTVNIALVKNGRPVMGIVTAPALHKCYWAVEGRGLHIATVDHWNMDLHQVVHKSVQVHPKINTVKIIGSRSHAN